MQYIIRVYININTLIKKWGEFMKVIGEIGKSFAELGVGMIFIDLILFVLIIVLVKCMKIKKVYEGFAKQLKSYEENEQLETKDKVLKSIIDSFVRAAELGIVNINLNAIINKNLDKLLINAEKNIKIYGSVIEVLGILGTFLSIMITTMEYKLSLIHI